MCSLRGIQLAAGASPESTSESWVITAAQARILYGIKSFSSLSQPEAEAENPRIRAVVTGCRIFKESRGGGVIDEAVFIPAASARDFERRRGVFKDGERPLSKQRPTRCSKQRENVGLY